MPTLHGLPSILTVFMTYGFSALQVLFVLLSMTFAPSMFGYVPMNLRR